MISKCRVHLQWAPGEVFGLWKKRNLLYLFNNVQVSFGYNLFLTDPLDNHILLLATSHKLIADEDKLSINLH